MGKEIYNIEFLISRLEGKQHKTTERLWSKREDNVKQDLEEMGRKESN